MTQRFNYHENSSNPPRLTVAHQVSGATQRQLQHQRHGLRQTRRRQLRYPIRRRQRRNARDCDSYAPPVQRQPRDTSRTGGRVDGTATDTPTPRQRQLRIRHPTATATIRHADSDSDSSDTPHRQLRYPNTDCDCSDTPQRRRRQPVPQPDRTHATRRHGPPVAPTPRHPLAHTGPQVPTVTAHPNCELRQTASTLSTTARATTSFHLWPSGGNFHTVTPTKAALPGSPGIDTSDIIARATAFPQSRNSPLGMPADGC